MRKSVLGKRGGGDFFVLTKYGWHTSSSGHGNKSEAPECRAFSLSRKQCSICQILLSTTLHSNARFSLVSANEIVCHICYQQLSGKDKGGQKCLVLSIEVIRAMTWGHVKAPFPWYNSSCQSSTYVHRILHSSSDHLCASGSRPLSACTASTSVASALVVFLTTFDLLLDAFWFGPRPENNLCQCKNMLQYHDLQQIETVANNSRFFPLLAPRASMDCAVSLLCCSSSAASPALSFCTASSTSELCTVQKFFGASPVVITCVKTAPKYCTKLWSANRKRISASTERGGGSRIYVTTTLWHTTSRRLFAQLRQDEAVWGEGVHISWNLAHYQSADHTLLVFHLTDFFNVCSSTLDFNCQSLNGNAYRKYVLQQKNRQYCTKFNEIVQLILAIAITIHNFDNFFNSLPPLQMTFQKVKVISKLPTAVPDQSASTSCVDIHDIQKNKHTWLFKDKKHKFIVLFDTFLLVFHHHTEPTGALCFCDAEKRRVQNAVEKRTGFQHWRTQKRDAER